MIVCSCLVITDKDIETALVEILSQPDAPLPTPGVVYRHLAKKMVCCGCSPLAVSTIYEKIDELAEQGRRLPLRLRLRARPPAQVRQRHAGAAADRAAADPAPARRLRQPPLIRQRRPARAGRIAVYPAPHSRPCHWPRGSQVS